MTTRRILSVCVAFVLSFTVVSVVKAEDVLMKNVESVCMETHICTQQGFNKCSVYSSSPLVRVHRAHLTLNDSLTSDELYIEECFEVPGLTDDFCVPYAIRQVGGQWKIKNHLPTGGQELTWTNGGKELVQNTLLQMCIANYANSAQGLARCDGIFGPNGSYYDPNPPPNEDTGWNTGSQFLTDKNYAFHGIYRGVSSPAETPLTPIEDFPVTGQRGSTFEWGSFTSTSTRRTFRAIAFSMPLTGTSGNDPSNKVGQLGFTTGEGSCETSANYDPFGRVFASSNLEPVAGAKVALYREMEPVPPVTTPTYDLVTRNMGIIGYAFENPQDSGALGYFSFAVPPGTYRLLVLPAGVTAPPQLVDPVLIAQNPMDENATRFGESVVVAVQNGQETLYPKVYQVTVDTTNNLALALPNIIEGTVPERRDIAVNGLEAQPPTALNHKRTANHAGDWIVRGRINKPFGIATLKRRSDQAVVGQANADADGRYVVEIPRANLRPNDSVVVNAAAVPLTQVTPPHSMMDRLFTLLQTIFSHDVQAQNVSNEMVIEPRLSYLEGYAYDNAGNVLRNAEVTIFDKSLRLPVYSTKTDSKGYYSVTSENLPINDYLIWYMPEGSTNIVTVDSEKFYEQNKDYVEKMNIDVMKPKYSKPAEVYLTQNPEPTYAQGQNPGADVRPGTSGTPRDPVAPTRAMGLNETLNQQVSPALLMYVAILLLLIVGAGLLIVYYMKRKQEPHLYE